ncbi:MAG: phenylalanine--tRNA ligase subunit beta [Bacteroidales bacterium]|nr:phenylalanine--tRNA ligase subunit beta [Bacteroidales bacterium]
MNISYKWLKQYVDFDLTADELAAALTSIGLETGSVELVETIKGGLAGIVIGKVLTCDVHPDSDHLHITTVELGQGPVQIVCGAPNVAAGQTVVVATVGTTLYSPEGEAFKIKKSKIRGVESFGMICAEDEIGIGASHDGIMVLPPEADAYIGKPAADFFKIENDYVLEVDLTPNRIDAASHYGVARDLAAWLSCHKSATKAHLPQVDNFKIDNPDKEGFSVEINDPDGVTRYCGVTIEGVKIGPSPEWLRNALSTIGLHSINNVVDVTNFILHGIGQPLHSFDGDTLAGRKVIVRRAKTGDKFTTLDGVEHTLDGADLMICDNNTERCIAGVFGGLNSGVTDTTTTIFLESACFNPTSVRRTARRHGISTDSSFRFERGVDPNGCLYALKLATLLIQEVAGGKTVGQVTDYYPNHVAPFHVDMNFDDFEKLIGRQIPRSVVDGILNSLEIKVDAEPNGNMHLDVPTYRVDVRRACDVIEDVLRIYGYNNIQMSDELHACLSFKTPVDAADDLRRTISEQLTGAGWNEILNNSLTAEAYYNALSEFPANHCIKLLNPLSQELNVLRQTLLFGGLESLAHNINRKSADLALYEFGNVYFLNPDKTSDAEHPLAPYSEAPRLALWMTGANRDANWLRSREEATFFDLKAAVANVLARVGISSANLKMTVAQLPEGSIFSAAIDLANAKGVNLGRMGIIAPAIAKSCDIKVPVYYAELDWAAICRIALRTNALYEPLPKTQAVKRDLSLLIDNKVTFDDIQAAVAEAERKLLRKVELFDVYEGDRLPAGKKSYAISISLQDPEKTLQDKHIDKIMTKVIENLKRKFNAELR